MYCIQCGVKLADTEKCCPLCETEVFHPDLIRKEVRPMYPGHAYPAAQVNSRAALIIWTTFSLIAMITSLWCDFQISGSVDWAGYVTGALLLIYVAFALPGWFRKPNPVIFVPCTFAAAGLYLLYINMVTNGDWFLTFAFPVTGYLGLVVTAVVVLFRYLRRGYLFVFGGALVALGGFMPLMELLLCVTFDRIRFLGWSMYPLIALSLLGGMLIFLGIHRPTREMMERKFFL